MLKDFSKFLPALAVLAAFLLAGTAFTYFFHLREVVAIDGFSIVEYLAQKNHPENFVRDFPGGTMAGDVSLLTELYYPLQLLTHIPGLTLMTIMIWLEIACVFAGAWVFWRFIDSKSDDMHLWGYAWLCIILTLSSVISPDLANFKFPYFHGQFYGYADALRIAAIACVLGKRWNWAAFLIALAFMIHPIKAVGAGVFILAAVLADARTTISLRSFLWGALTFIFCGVWAYFKLGLGHPSDVTSIDPSEFISFTRIFQAHWYPLDLGLFGEWHVHGVSPFMGLMVMLCVSIYQIDISQTLRKQILCGYAALAAVVVAGIAISTQIVPPILIKLALARFSDLMTLLVPFFILGATLTKWRAQQWHWVALYMIFLIAGFAGTQFMAPGLAIIAVAMLLIDVRKIHHMMPQPPALLGTLTLAMMIVLWIFYPESNNPFLLTVKLLILVAIAYGLLIVVTKLPSWMRLGLTPNAARITGLTLVLLICGTCWAIGKNERSPDYIAKGQDFYAAQIWANANTEPTALFMVDPCQIYGWRDFSERASIGTPREWFMTGWIYKTDGRVLERGKSISQTLGLDINQYLVPATEKPITDSNTICTAAQTLYYDPSRQVYKRLNTEQGVDYFVLEKPKSDAVTINLKTPPLFSNTHYAIYAAKDLLP